MSENKFIKHLKGKQTAKSLVEIDNQSAKTSFGKMPAGTSDSIVQYSDHRGNVTVVANGTTNWKIDGSDLVLATNVYGDGQDFLSTASVSGTGLWINASYTFPSTGDPRHPIAMVFNPSTKWVLKVCGDNLIVDGGSTIDFTMLVKIGTANVYSKNFTVRESAGQFSKEFVIDFGEANLDIVKAGGLSTLTVQLLCGTANASARIYNGMSVLTCLQRKVDASAVSNNGGNVEDVLNGSMIPVDYFSNPAFIDQIEDGDEAYAVFTRDGDNVDLSGWAQPIPDQANNNGKFLTTDGSDMSWEQIEISNVDGLQTELTDLQDQINDKVNETSTANQVYGTDNNGDQTTYNVSDLGAVDDVRVNNVSVVTSKIANIDLTSYLKNTATATDAITVNGIANTSWVNGINIGKDSRINSNNGVAIGVDASADVNAVGIGRDTDAGVRGTAIGAYAKTSYDTGIAIGCWNSVTHNAVSSAKGAYQFGVGTNSTPRTLNVGWYNDSTSPSTFVNYQLLDGDTGLIPDARISTNIARLTDIPGDFTGATAGDAGANGLVPAPAAGDQAKFLQGDGTWANPTAATAWGNITGILSDQTDLQNALDGKADVATTLAGYGITDGANTDLSNLTSVGQNISNWSSNVTNCITNIPQDIKLELNSGTLTLKAGSKVYVPNGAGVFDVVNITNDLNYFYSDASHTSSLFYNRTTNTLYGETSTGSGTGTNPPQAYYTYYNTSLNIIRRSTNGTTWLDDNMSLPLCIFKSTQGVGITSIDQVFNGFGYIGSTVFALPGVKALIPNGKNADGTLKNTEVSVSTVKTSTLQYDSEQIWSFTTSTGSISGDTINPGQSVYFVKNLKNMYGLGITSGYNKCYVEETNLWYQNQNTSTWTVVNMCLFAHTRSSSLKITSFNSKTDFHAVDYNDTDFIAHQAMPSDRYVNLTLGASGTTYTAPADGYVTLIKEATSAQQYIEMSTGQIFGNMSAIYNGQLLYSTIPVSKGATFQINYNAGGSTNKFGFSYANGAQ